MSDNIKNKIVTITFLVLIFGLFLINVFKAPTDVSMSERRKLAQFPVYTTLLGKVSNEFIEKYDDLRNQNKTLYSLLELGERIKNSKLVQDVSSTKYMTDFATATVEQFVWRDNFRAIKASFLFNVLKQKENNGIYIVDGHASKLLTELKEGELTQTVKNINKLYRNNLSNMNVYYSIIPDKNYFLAEKNGYPHIDYNRFMEIVKTNMSSNIKYIDIFEELDVDDYYTTDIHWKQENLGDVTNKLLGAMNGSATKQLNFSNDYEAKELYPFYGTYYGQSALPLDAEKLNYLTNKDLENVTVKILNEETFEFEEKSMYDIAEFTGIDPYNVYLSGPKAIITLENSNAKINKELVIFRDSFGSSLAPLLSTEYSKVTLIDLRYIASPILRNVVDFNAGQDVLIIYSTEVLNNGSILKIM